MRAIQYKKFGPPEVLQMEDLELGRPKDNEVLVKLHATSVNPIDWKFRKGMLKPLTRYKLPLIPGGDISGTIEEIGFDENYLQVGDKVFGITPAVNGGSYAEYALVKAKFLWHKPENASFEETAGIPIAGLTAYQGLYHKGKIHPRMRVLINGCTGGVGSYAVQIAKAYDCEVFGICSTQNADFAMELGVDHILTYDQQNPLRTRNKFDIFYDVHGSYSFDDVKHLVYQDGKYITTQPSFSTFYNSVTRKRVESLWVESNRQDLANMKAMYEKGIIKTKIDKVYDLKDAALAHEHAQKGNVRGKIIIKIDN